MTNRSIHLLGAKGGVGTSTIAAALSAELQAAGCEVFLSSADDDAGDLRALLGLCTGYDREPVHFVAPAGAERVTIIDHGTSTTDGRLLDGGEIFLVVRPCYVGLRRALAMPVRPDGVILVSEKDRSLGRADVEDVLGLRIVAEIPVLPSIARSIDAGILGMRRPRELSLPLADLTRVDVHAEHVLS